MKKTVSVIIPTKNSEAFLDDCLKSLSDQSYSNIEIIIVDSGSVDATLKIAKKYSCKIYSYRPKINFGLFEAPHKRNYGVKRAKGEYIYYLDADMELGKNVIKEAVSLCGQGYDGAIICEDSFGEGIWAQAKNLERRCYWGDNTVEAPRFISKQAWVKVGGLDVAVGGGGDDWDLFQKLLERGFKVGRIKSLVMHNEGRLSLVKLMKKRYMYGRQSIRYISKRPAKGIVSYFPIRMAYLRHWRLFLSRPKDSLAFVIMRTAEYSAGFAGIIYSTLNNKV